MSGSNSGSHFSLIIIISAFLLLFSASDKALAEAGCECPMAPIFELYYTSPGGEEYLYGAVDLGPASETNLCGYPYPLCATKTCKVRVLVYYNSAGTKYEIITETRQCAPKKQKRTGGDPVCAD